jgi:phenylpropionate dioxygenase-like ring-hydroxylating dioxygenase large terminal subunit
MGESASPQSARRRGTKIEFRPPGTFHRGWYPVALSSEIARSQVVGAPFLDGRIVIARSSAGVVNVLSAYCRHLGVDLATGRMVDDQIECAFHRWRYGQDGACTATATGDPAPRVARLFRYPTAESLGLIWAFNGDGEPGAVPGFSLAPPAIAFEAFRNPVIMPVESSVVVLNSFDLQHFRAVHGMEIEVDMKAAVKSEGTLDYVASVRTAEFGSVRQQRRLWGVNTMTIEAIGDNGRTTFLLHSLCPTAADRNIGFLVVGSPLAADGSNSAEVSQSLTAARRFSLRLVEEDRPIFESIRFRRDCLTASDAFLSFGMEYISSFPAAHPGREFIT